MIVNRFLEGDLDNLMLFLDDNITENYEKGVFLTIMKRWPEGFLVMRSDDSIVGVACGAIQPNSKLRILIIALAKDFRRKGHGRKPVSYTHLTLPTNREV